MAESPLPAARSEGFRPSVQRAREPIDEQTQLSLRIVAHLARVGPPDENGVGRPGSTQEGMAETLAVTQGAVSKVLQKLLAVDLVRRELHHVPGRVRRVEVYALTRRGELMLEEMRARLTLLRGAPEASDGSR